jgi:hypothetical protein
MTAIGEGAREHPLDAAGKPFKTSGVADVRMGCKISPSDFPAGDPVSHCLTARRDVDIFYHWRDFALDMKEGRIGTLGSDGALLEQPKERLPRKVWTFVTPKGKKDRLQLIGSFLITESKPVSFVPKWKYNLFYDAAFPRSVLKPIRIAQKKSMR